MPFKQTMYDKDGKIIDSCPFIFEVELDELETFNNAKLNLKPLDSRVVITRQYYEFDESELKDPYDFERLEVYECNFFYNDEKDELILNVFNGFDVAIFNICALLGIGRITIDDIVPNKHGNFAPIHDKVSQVIFTLDEFKKLDGFVAWFKFTPHFILFKGVVLGFNYLHDSVGDGDVPHYFREGDLYARGENLFIID